MTSGKKGEREVGGNTSFEGAAMKKNNINRTYFLKKQWGDVEIPTRTPSEAHPGNRERKKQHLKDEK